MTTIDAKFAERIRQELEGIEIENGVRIAFACESGSRAWGFASKDSDYDVRFIYARPEEWYLSISIERERDVIEVPIDDQLDVSGWDIRKALQLLSKSNHPLIEWLGSPIVYVDKWGLAGGLKSLLEDCYSPISCGYHYLSMAKANYRGYLRGEQVRIKKYFYVLRPLLAVVRIEQKDVPPPTEFDKLVTAVVDDDTIRHEIEHLLLRKRDSLESDSSDKIPVLNRFIERELERLETSQFVKQEPAPSLGRFNKLFRNTLRDIWV